MYSRLAFLFVLYYVAVAMTQPQNRFLFLHPFQPAQLAFLVACGFHFLAVTQEGRPVVRWGPATKFAFVLLFMGLLSQYFNPLASSTAWNGFIDQLVKGALAVILLEATATNIYRVWAVQGTILLTTLWWIKAGLRLGHAGAIYAGDRIMGPAVSMVENPNAYAYFTCVTICVYLYFFQQYHNKYLKGGFLAMAVASVWIVFNTGSRTGMVLLFFLALFLLPKYGTQHKTALIVIALATPLLFGTIGAMNVERFRTIPDSARAFFRGEVGRDLRGLDADAHSAAERSLKNQDTWRLIKRYPLMGAGMLPDNSLFTGPYTFAYGQVHNEFLMAGRQMGFPGLALYITMLFILFQRGLKVQLYAKGWWPAMSDLGWTFKLQALVIAVGGFFNPLPWNTYTMVLVASASALWLNLQEGRIYPEAVPGEGLATAAPAPQKPELAAARSG